jgi:hypothetical protein
LRHHMFYFLLIVVWKLGEKNHWLPAALHVRILLW